MSNLGEVAGKNGGALNTIGAVFGLLADISGVVSILQLIPNLSSQDDELQQVLDSIQTGFSQLEGQISASDKLQRMREIEQAIIPAVTVFKALSLLLSETPPPSLDEKHNRIFTCLQTIEFFTDPASNVKWQVASADLPYYSDPWSGKLAPESGVDGLAFNYTYTLPQFLRAIYILLTAIRALDPSTALDHYQPILSECFTRLESIHDAIVSSGIVGTKMPTIADVGHEGERFVEVELMSLPVPAWISNWWASRPGFPTDPRVTVSNSPADWPYGAVEIYSAVNNVSSYWEDLPASATLDGWPNQNKDNFLRLLKLRILRQKKALYNQLGMPVVRQVINQLRQLTGQPLFTDVPYGEWTVGEVFSILGLDLPKRSGVRAGLAQLDLSAIESALAAFLQETPPYTSFEAFLKTQIPALPLPTGSLYTFLTGASLGESAIMK